MNQKKIIGKKINQKAFSLLEALVSMALFIMIIGSVVLFSFRTIQAHTKSQAMQSTFENANFAVLGLGKKIRTSQGAVGGNDGTVNDYSATNQVFLIDNVDRTQYCYRFNATDKTLEVASAPAAPIFDNCSELATVSVFVPIVGSSKVMASGSFYVADSNSTQRGRLKIVVKLSYKLTDETTEVFEKDSIIIQTTVSFRDYKGFRERSS